MKRVLIIVLALLSGATLWSQDKSYQNRELLKYIRSGFSKDGILELSVNSDYGVLSQEQQKQVLQLLYPDFPHSKVIVRMNNKEAQLWVPQAGSYVFASVWNIDTLPLKDYGPLELNKFGERRFFYYTGGSFGSVNGTSNGMVNLRAGTFLYKNIWEISATLDLGYSSAAGKTQFNGDIGAMTRAYLPWRIPKVNMAPYAGAGVSLYFSPKVTFEGQLLAGLSWFVGPGSFDLGVKYGIQSGFSTTFGYTFRLALK